MNYWIFVVAHQNIDGQDCTPYTKLEQRLEDKFWGLGEQVPYRRQLDTGDTVVFYVASPHMEFAATAILASPYRELSKQDQKKYGHNSPCYRSEYGVFLEKTQRWDTPRSLAPLIEELTFTRNANNLGLVFRRSIIKMGEDDFQIIAGER